MTISPPDLSLSPDDHVVGITPEEYAVSYAREDENFLPLEGEVTRYLISGRGRKSRDDCGTFHGAFKHQLYNKFKSRRYTCHRQGCPECFRTWAAMYSDKLRAFLEGYARLANVRWWHCTFAPDPRQFLGGLEYEVDWKEMLDACIAWMRRWHRQELGELAVVYVRHPRSLKCCREGLEPGTICGHSMENHVLPDTCPACKKPADWRWVLQPHLHLVTNFMYAKQHAGCALLDLSMSCDAVFVNINVKRRMPPLQGEALRRVLAYELGHALWSPSNGKGTGMKAVNYCGAIGRNKVVRSEKVIREKDVGDDGIVYEQVVASGVEGGYKVKVPFEFVLDERGHRIVKMRPRYETTVRYRLPGEKSKKRVRKRDRWWVTDHRVERGGWWFDDEDAPKNGRRVIEDDMEFESAE